ncbi:MAG: ribosome maturation factor RimM [Nitrospira sp.]|nr:ribosome maturation factor RimM [Nitrospira sp.]MCP9442883.1 ribosome maturation factor RimM [Nitrospira sp.]
MAIERDFVTVGRIQRPFGVKGEVKVRPLSDVPDRLETLSKVSLVAKDGRAMDTSVTRVRRAGSEFIVGFADLTTPEAAKLWCGGFIQVTRGTVPALPADHYYECDLVGLTVQNDRGQRIGILEEIWELPAHHVFVIRHGEEETLVPAVREWVTRVDLEKRLMTVRMMDSTDERDASV